MTIAIVGYIIPIEIIKLQNVHAIIFVVSFYIIARFYILIEMYFFPAKMNKYVNIYERIKPLFIPIIGPIYSQFVHTTPVVEIDSRTISSSFNFTSMKYYNSGIVFFNQLYEQIELAQNEIILYFYIVGNDKLVEQFANLLIRKHKEGIKIRVKIDALGAIDAYKSFYALLKKHKINIEIVSPTKYYDLNNILSYRTHKKFVIIDNQICYIGGMNLAQEYLGYSSKFGNWEDYMVKIKSNELAKILKKNFMDKRFSIKNHLSSSKILIENGSSKTDKIYRSFVEGIKNAKKRVIIVSPYVSLTEELTKIIENKSKTVPITFIVPGKSDGKFYAENVLKSTLSNFENVEIREIENTFVHTKLYFFDDRVLFGSVNFDMRSFFINDEILVSTKSNFKFERELNRLLQISKIKKYPKFKTIYHIFKNAM